MEKKPDEQLLTVADIAFYNQKRQELTNIEDKEKPDGALFYFRQFPNKIMIYDESSCNVFDKGPIRNCIVYISVHPCFENIIIIAIFLNSLLLAIYDYGDRQNKNLLNKTIDQSGVYFTLTFMIEASIKIIAMGFIMHKNSYLRDPWNWLDFFVIIISLIEYLPFIDGANLKALRVLRVLRPLKSINAFPGIRKLIGTLLSSLRALFESFIFMTFIFILFAIMGVRLFKGVLYQRCRTTPEPILDPLTQKLHWPIAEDVDRLCTLDGSGNFQCPSQYTCGQISDYDIDFATENVLDQPLIAYGYVGFDNIGRAMLTLFQMITLEGWTDVMYNLSDATLANVSNIYCFSVIIMGSFMLLNLVLAVISEAFDEVDGNQQAEQDKINALINHQKQIYDINDAEYEAYLEDSFNGDRSQTSHMSTISLTYSQKNNLIGDVEQQQKVLEIAQELSAEEKEVLRNRFQSVCFKICTHQSFTIIITLLSVVNMVVLAFDRYPLSKSEIYQLNLYNDIFTFIFIGDMVVKIIGLGVRDYFADDFNKFDFLIIMFSLLEIMLGMLEINLSGGAISALRALRLLRVFKLARSWKSFRELLQKMLMTLQEMSNFCLLMFIFIFTYSLLGLEIYSYRVKYQTPNKMIPITDNDYEGDVYYPRENFNTFINAFTTVFIILIGEDWNNIMFDYLRSVGWTSYLFFMTLYIQGNLILLNLFLAILLKNFEEDQENYGKDEVIALNYDTDMSDNHSDHLHSGESSSEQDDNDDDNYRKAIEDDSFNSHHFSQQQLSIYEYDIGDDQEQEASMNLQRMPLIQLRKARDFDTRSVNVLPYQRNLHINGVFSEDNQFSQLGRAQDTMQFIDRQQDESNQSQIKDEINFLSPASIYMPNVWERNNENRISAKKVTKGFDFNINFTFREDGKSDHPNQIKNSYHHSQSTNKVMNWSPNNSFNFFHQRDQDEMSNGQQSENVLKYRSNSNRSGFSSYSSQKSKGSIIQHKEQQISQTQRQNLIRFKKAASQCSMSTMKSREVRNKKQVNAYTLKGKSLGILGVDNTIRQISAKIISNTKFEYFILLLIVFSSMLLTLEGPYLDPDGDLSKKLKKIDCVVTVLFLCELILKVLMHGLIFNGPDSYLLNSWNILDFIIVFLSLLLLILQDSAKGHVKLLRMLRVLRPLRMISRNPGMRTVIMSMVNAIPDIGNMMIVSVLVQCLFSILGTNLYKGTFYFCDNQNILNPKKLNIRDKFDCMDYGGEWVNRDQNFDNFVHSMVTFTNIMTTEGWIDVMWYGVDATKIDMVQKEGNNPYQMWFFIIVVIISSLFILNMFVGITINVFNQEKAILEKNYLLTKTQQEWTDAMISVYKSFPIIKFKESSSALRNHCFKISDSKYFQSLILGFILLNTITLAMTWYNEPDYLAAINEKINLIFNLTFTTEALIKLIALQRDYFKEGWNIFDFMVVTITWIEKMIKYFLGIKGGTIATLIRTLRIGRVFRFLKKHRNMRIIFNTFIESFPQLSNVGSLLFLLIFIYSILGVFMFGEIKLQSDLNVHANFQTFSAAFLTLFRMSTGESWHTIMYDAARSESIQFSCVESQTYQDRVKNGTQQCGVGMASSMFFTTFMVMISFVFLNLFIVIIFESFNAAKAEDGNKVTQLTLEKMNGIWSQFDPTGSKFVRIEDLQPMIEMLLEEEIEEYTQARIEYTNGNIEKHVFKKMNFMFGLYKDLTLIEVTLLKRKQCNGNHSEQIKKKIFKYIYKLQLPFYNKFQDIYYYDFLEALTRQLFQGELFDAKILLIKNKEATKISSYGDKLTVVQEQEVGLAEGDLNTIIFKVEKKGQKYDISKFQQMKRLRTNRNQWAMSKLDLFDDFVINSSHLRAMLLLKTFIQKWRLRQQRKQQQRFEAAEVERAQEALNKK